jgi:hypothetical protein
MALLNQDMEVFANDDDEIDIQIFEADGTTPMNITGTTLSWKAADLYDQSIVLIAKDSGALGGVVITDPANGLAKLLLSETDKAVCRGYPYYPHEIVVIDASLTRVTALTGKLTVDTSLG